MSPLAMLDRIGIDRFTIVLVATVITASLLPVQGTSAEVLKYLIDFVIGLMFFLYGARLPREVVLEGLSHWRLHLLVLLSTFTLFPLLGLAIGAATHGLMSPDLYIGVLFLCALPSTVQSSIAFTSIARGNVSAAICSASASNLLGIVLTPLLMGVLLSAHGSGFSLHAIGAIALQLLLPFVLGQIVRPRFGVWAIRHRALLGYTDRGSILLVVYGAFSEAMVSGIWHQLPHHDLLVMVLVDAVLLASVLAVTTVASRLFGFSREDEIAIVFCGSKKSLASGVPMASILFSGHAVGVIVLPVMLFHQIQLMTCAVLARRYAQASKVPQHTLGLSV